MALMLRLYSARIKASWRSGYAEDCKSLHPSSILGEASILSQLATLEHILLQPHAPCHLGKAPL